MNAFQKQSFKLLVDPIEQSSLFRKRRKRTKGSMHLKAYYFEKQDHLTIIRQNISINAFFKITNNGPFVQSITNDNVRANDIRREH